MLSCHFVFKFFVFSGFWRKINSRKLSMFSLFWLLPFFFLLRLDCLNWAKTMNFASPLHAIFPCTGSKRAISQDGHILAARVANQNTKLAHIDRGRPKLYDNSSYCLFLNYLGSDVKMIVHSRNFPMEGQKSEENYARPRKGPELQPRQRKWVRGIQLKCNRLKVSKF